VDPVAFDALAVDLDGTVWDSAPWYAELTTTSSKQAELVGGQLRSGAAGVNAASLLKTRFTPTKFETACRDHAEELHLYPGLLASLAVWKRVGPIAVVTNLPAWVAAPMLKATGLMEMFDLVQTARRGVPAKPHSAPMRFAAEALGLHPSAFLYVGDAASDQKAASQAGMGFAWASWGYGVDLVCDMTLATWSDLRSPA